MNYYLALVPEAELSANLELVVKTLLLKGTPGDLVGLGIDRDGHCFVKVWKEKERERRGKIRREKFLFSLSCEKGNKFYLWTCDLFGKK